MFSKAKIHRFNEVPVVPTGTSKIPIVPKKTVVTRNLSQNKSKHGGVCISFQIRNNFTPNRSKVNTSSKCSVKSKKHTGVCLSSVRKSTLKMSNSAPKIRRKLTINGEKKQNLLNTKPEELSKSNTTAINNAAEDENNKLTGIEKLIYSPHKEVFPSKYITELTSDYTCHKTSNSEIIKLSSMLTEKEFLISLLKERCSTLDGQAKKSLEDYGESGRHILAITQKYLDYLSIDVSEMDNITEYYYNSISDYEKWSEQILEFVSNMADKLKSNMKEYVHIDEYLKLKNTLEQLKSKCNSLEISAGDHNLVDIICERLQTNETKLQELNKMVSVLENEKRELSDHVQSVDKKISELNKQSKNKCCKIINRVLEFETTILKVIGEIENEIKIDCVEKGEKIRVLSLNLQEAQDYIELLKAEKDNLKEIIVSMNNKNRFNVFILPKNISHKFLSNKNPLLKEFTIFYIQFLEFAQTLNKSLRGIDIDFSVFATVPRENHISKESFYTELRLYGNDEEKCDNTPNDCAISVARLKLCNKDENHVITDNGEQDKSTTCDKVKKIIVQICDTLVDSCKTDEDKFNSDNCRQKISSICKQHCSSKFKNNCEFDNLYNDFSNLVEMICKLKTDNYKVKIDYDRLQNDYKEKCLDCSDLSRLLMYSEKQLADARKDFPNLKPTSDPEASNIEFQDVDHSKIEIIKSPDISKDKSPTKQLSIMTALLASEMEKNKILEKRCADFELLVEQLKQKQNIQNKESVGIRINPDDKIHFNKVECSLLHKIERALSPKNVNTIPRKDTELKKKITYCQNKGKENTSFVK